MRPKVGKEGIPSAMVNGRLLGTVFPVLRLVGELIRESLCVAIKVLNHHDDPHVTVKKESRDARGGI